MGQYEMTVSGLRNWIRPYLQYCYQRPRLRYSVFGHWPENGDFLVEAVRELPEGIHASVVDLSSIQQEVSWHHLVKKRPAVAERLQTARRVLLLQGEVLYQDDLDYLKQTMDFVTHLCLQEERFVCDLFTSSWYDSQEWVTLADRGGIFNPFDHVVLLTSEGLEDSRWLHTRGMMKFGRPDLSVSQVASEDFDSVKKMIDRFINYQALGGVIEAGRTITMTGLRLTYEPSEIRGGKDDPDFDNTHIALEAV